MKQMKLIAFSIFLIILLIQWKNKSNSSELVYKSGENLKYLMYYGWFDGGYAYLSLEESKLDTLEVFHAKMFAKSIGITDKLYRVRDIYESYFDKHNTLSYKGIRNIHENNYKFYNETVYNRKDTTVESQKSGTHKITAKTTDMLSTLYMLRNELSDFNFQQDSFISFSTFFGDELFPLKIRFLGLETISTKLGKINCLKFAPLVEVGRVFKTKDDMTIWFSNDRNYLPIRVKFELFIGSLKCDLIEYEGLKYEFLKNSR